MATGVGDIFLDLKLNKQPFEKGLNETKATATMAGKKIGMAIAGAIAGAVATVGFGHLISSTAKLGDAVDKTSQKMGMSAQAYQEWDFIMNGLLQFWSPETICGRWSRIYPGRRKRHAERILPVSCSAEVRRNWVQC